jgi:hypothetical protein
VYSDVGVPSDVWISILSFDICVIVLKSSDIIFKQKRKAENMRSGSWNFRATTPSLKFELLDLVF